MTARVDSPRRTRMLQPVQAGELYKVQAIWKRACDDSTVECAVSSTARRRRSPCAECLTVLRRLEASRTSRGRRARSVHCGRRSTVRRWESACVRFANWLNSARRHARRCGVQADAGIGRRIDMTLHDLVLFSADALQSHSLHGAEHRAIEPVGSRDQGYLRRAREGLLGVTTRKIRMELIRE